MIIDITTRHGWVACHHDPMMERVTAVENARTSPLLVSAIIGSQFAPAFMFSGVAVALPALGADLGAGATSLGLVESLFLAGSVAFLLPAGRLADACDKGSLYKLGLLAFGLTSLLVGLVSSLPLILILRFLQGATSALVVATAPALLSDLVPPERQGRVYGSMLGAIYAGLTLGPVCAGLLIHLWGWRSVFLVAGALLVLVCALTLAMLPSSWRRPTSGAVHLPSSVLVAAAMLLLVLGVANLDAGALGYTVMTAGLGLAILSVAWQRRLQQPLLDVGLLLQNAVLRNALLVQCLLYTNAFCSIFMLSIYMQTVLDRSANVSGQVLAVGTILMAAIAPLAGWLADRYRAQRIATAGVAVVLVSPLLAMTLNEYSSLLMVAAVLAFQGVGFALFSSPNMKIAMNSVGPSQASIAAALTGTSRSVGMLAGMFITAAVISIELGDAAVGGDPARFVSVMGIAFLVLAALTLADLVTSVVGGRRTYLR